MNNKLTFLESMYEKLFNKVENPTIKKSHELYEIN